MQRRDRQTNTQIRTNTEACLFARASKRALAKVRRALAVEPFSYLSSLILSSGHTDYRVPLSSKKADQSRQGWKEGRKEGRKELEGGAGHDRATC